MIVQRPALTGENLGIGLQQITALHTGPAWASTDQQRVVNIVEAVFHVVMQRDGMQQRVGTVFQLHRQTTKRLHTIRHFDQLQNHRLILAEHLTAGDLEQQVVTDGTGGTGDGYPNRSAHWGLLQLGQGRKK